MTAAGITTTGELASGKGHRDENFPVASLLLKRAHRAPILAFYRFARTADDVADHPTAPPEVKLARLDAMRDAILGTSDAEPHAAALARVIAAQRLDRQHALDLLAAFRRDVTVRRYADWDALIDYCRVSAMPVGRFVLDVHGEDRACWPASDALCAALQIVNHLQDCGADYRVLDRVYLPQDMLAAAGAHTAELGAARASPALRHAIAGMAKRAGALLDEAGGFARAVRDRRLGVEIAIIRRLAVSLARRLERRDPLGQRVHHRKPEALALAGGAALAQMLRR